MSLKVKIILGSTRPGRIVPIVGKWVEELAREQNGFDVEVVDLKEIDLPLLDEAGHPRAQAYEHEHTKKWAAKIAEADAFVFLTPEYNSFPSAALVNAIQALAVEWERKVAAVVSYGGVSGGMRAAQELRQLLVNMNVMALPQSVPVPFVFNFIGDDGVLRPEQPVVDGLKGMFNELAVWGEALKPSRAQAA
ncbi:MULTISPECIES: NADPH-dependent FMN reductase [Roseobacteraceae]|uniref:NADPH-dependent FMN reductase n=1 Tax=Roseobacteraceae TaxID=2854170 RepID=UPI0013BB5430|nr:MULTISPECIES: NAD(P)H-dependent oxidoreductase [unclassified Salipiger]NDV54110.1 NAD(P)H-dependent oxidoreductase [Salipiger sp. PrR003]NDW32283.1 NAD(P)H-dependent oxidoreductase [Salipiger sp. PrR007]